MRQSRRVLTVRILNKIFNEIDVQMSSHPSFFRNQVRNLAVFTTPVKRFSHQVTCLFCVILLLSFTSVNLADDSTLEIQVISSDQAIELPERSDAEKLAERLLMEESSEPVLDLNELQQLSAEIQTGLNAVREFEPSMSAISARESFRSDMLIINLRSDLRKKVKEIIEDGLGGVMFITGFEEFDELNRKLELFTIQYFKHVDIFLFYFAIPINVPAASIQYSEMKGVEFAEPDENLVEWTDIEVYQRDGRLIFVFKLPPNTGLTEQFGHEMFFLQR